MATSNNNVQPSLIDQVTSVASSVKTDCLAVPNSPSNNMQSSWNPEPNTSAATPSDDEQSIQPTESRPVLAKAPFVPRENFGIKISNNPSVPRVVTSSSSLQVIRNEEPVLMTLAHVNTTVPLVNHLPCSSNHTKVSAKSVATPGRSFPFLRYPQVLVMFKRPCFEMMNNRKCTSSCTFNHDAVPSTREILPKLLLLENDVISYVYSNFVMQTNQTFITYFAMMCEAFGLRKMESALIEAIGGCENLSKLLHFRFIFDGLTQTGLSQEDAMLLMIKHCNQTAASFTILIEIMFDTESIFFLQFMHSLYHGRDIANLGELIFNCMDQHCYHEQKYFRYLIFRTLEQIKLNQAPHLMHLFIKIFASYSTSDVCDLSVLQDLEASVSAYVNEIGDLDLAKKFNDIKKR